MVRSLTKSLVMKKILLTAMLLGLFVCNRANGLNNFFDEADVFFKKYVSNGSVAYSKIKSNIGEVESLYKQIGSMDLKGKTDAQKKAFYINAYNLAVIYWVAKHYPLKSPMDNSGFFDKVKHTVAGEELTLNALEIKKLLFTYKDARFHFALACAAKSCPPLASFAYTPDKVDQQLNDRTTLALNDPNWLKVNKSKKMVELSKIFEWYKKDFTSDGKSEIEWINQFRKEKIPTSYKVDYYEYNWALNE